MGFAHGTRMEGESREPGDAGVVGRDGLEIWTVPLALRKPCSPAWGPVATAVVDRLGAEELFDNRRRARNCRGRGSRRPRLNSPCPSRARHDHGLSSRSTAFRHWGQIGRVWPAGGVNFSAEQRRHHLAISYDAPQPVKESVALAHAAARASPARATSRHRRLPGVGIKALAALACNVVECRSFVRPRPHDLPTTE